MSDYTLQQKDSTDYPIITVTTENSLPRQHHTHVLHLTTVQLDQTNKQATGTDTDSIPQQTYSTEYTIIATTTDSS